MERIVIGFVKGTKVDQELCRSSYTLSSTLVEYKAPPTSETYRMTRQDHHATIVECHFNTMGRFTEKTMPTQEVGRTAAGPDNTCFFEAVKTLWWNVFASCGFEL
jgi:hypothetical protein